MNKKIYRGFAGALLMGASLMVMASGAQADMFRDSLQSAYDYSPRLKAEREALEVLNEAVNQAVSGWRPNVIGNYSVERQRTRFGTEEWSYEDADTRQLTLDQPIFQGGETIARIRSAKNSVKAGRKQLEAIEQNVLLDAVRAYMDVFQNQSVLELSHNNLEVLKKQLQATRDRFDVGEVTRTDVAQSEARVSRAESDYVQAQGALATAQGEFLRVMGHEAGTLTMPGNIPQIPASLNEAIEIAQNNNPDLLSSKYREQAADSDVWVRGAALLPSVNLQGTLRRETGAGIFGDSDFDTDSIGLNMRIPLYQSGAEYSRIREAKSQLQRRKFDILNTSDTVRENVTRAWEQLQTARAVIKAQEDNIRAAEIALDGVKQEQQYGARTTLDVLDAEQELFVARVNHVRARRDEVVAMYNLLSTLGSFTAQAVNLKVNYDPSIHYNDVKYQMIGF